ncbi:hypothetical protein GCM10008088_10780 [Mesonia mobilis]|uniref:Uncharacterized protein n=1 Tax=Mesonia mobilis TaxID=369791 RepID=A0ABQ3BPR0_9FLAO|nr:hypothetical protein GCM10008088_10780 [Mesonia mobilis]
MEFSKVIRVDFTKTSALAPGYATKIFTVVGAICGNCDIGNCLIASDPIKTIIIGITIANTGLCINRLNMIFKF